MEIFSALLPICVGNSPVIGEFPEQRPVTRSFNVFFDLHPNKRLSKQSWGWWFGTPSHPLWHHCNALTRWCRVMDICISKLTIISSDNSLSPGRRQAIIWTNAGTLLIGRTLGKKLQWNLNQNSYIFIQESAVENVVRKLADILSRPKELNNGWVAKQIIIT